MFYRASHIGAFEFAVLASLRAAQLSRGCVPRAESGHKVAVTAQLEVMAGKIVREVDNAPQDLPVPDLIAGAQASAVIDSRSK